jgi:hypothetical protein
MERRFLFQSLCSFLDVKKEGLKVSKEVFPETQHPIRILSVDSFIVIFSNAIGPVFWANIARRIGRSCAVGPAIQA